MPWDMPCSVWAIYLKLAEMMQDFLKLFLHLSGVGKDISKGNRNIFGDSWIEFLSHVKNNVLIKKNLKRKTSRHDPRVCTIIPKVIVLILLVHRCPEMNLHIDNTYREQWQVSIFWSIFSCNTWVHAGDGIGRRHFIHTQETNTCFLN